MKKLFALLLALCLLCAALPTLAETAATPSVAICVAGKLGDRSFYDSANEGLTKLAADFGTVTKVIECNEDASLYMNALLDAAQVCDIVAAVGWQFYDFLEDAADANPNTRFLFIDNALEEIPGNVMCITYAQNEGSYLAGYIAGKLSKTGAVGVVGGEDSDTINDFIVGYEAGARQANPDIRVERQYANDYEDPAKGKACALALYSAGCDIVFAVAGKTGEGVFEAAKETNNLAIGVDGDQKYIDPERIICSMMKQVGQSIYDVVSDADNAFLGGEIWNANMETGYVGVVYGSEDDPQQVDDALKAEVEAIKQQIIAGEIVVPTAFE